MALDVLTYALAKKVAEETAKGAGAIKGDKGDPGRDGAPGAPGADGAPGEKGDKGDAFTYDDFTPDQLEALKGPKGDAGEQGAKGDTGDQGVKGDDGFSPAVTVTEITDGHRVNITDKDHPQGQSFYVMNGKDGGDGIKTIGFSAYITDGPDYRGGSDTYTARWEEGSSFEALCEVIETVQRGEVPPQIVIDVTAPVEAYYDFYDDECNKMFIVTSWGSYESMPSDGWSIIAVNVSGIETAANRDANLLIMFCHPDNTITIKRKAIGGGGAGGGNANFDISTVPLGGAGVYEVNAFLNNNDSERVRTIYSRGANGELPDWFSMSVTSGLGTDDFHVATKEYADKEVAKKGNAKITFDTEYQYLQIRDDNGTDIGFSQETANTVRVQEYAKDSRGQVQKIFDEVLVSEAALENAVTESGFFVVDTATTYTYAQLKAIVQTGRVVVTHEGQTNVVISHDCVDDNLEGQNYIVLTVIKKIYSGGVPPVVLHYDWWGEIGGEFSFTSTKQSRVENVSNSFAGGTPSDLLTKSAIGAELNKKQDKLVSGTNIKTVNGESLLGEGNVEVAGGVNIEVGKEKWYGTYTDENGVTYQAYSKMIYIPALPATAGIEGYPHGITGIKQILQVYGFTTDGFVLNSPRQRIEDNIGIYQVQKAGNIQIEVGKDRSSKAAYVCLVYAKNN